MTVFELDICGSGITDVVSIGGNYMTKLAISMDDVTVCPYKISLTDITIVGDVLLDKTEMTVALYLTRVNVENVGLSTSPKIKRSLHQRHTYINIDACKGCIVQVVDCHFVNTVFSIGAYSNSLVSFLSNKFISKGDIRVHSALDLIFHGKFGKHSVEVKMCKFEGYLLETNTSIPVGSMSLLVIKSSTEIKILIEDTEFVNNTRGLDVSLKGQTNLFVRNCLFSSHNASGSGAGMRITETRESGLGAVTTVKQTKIVVTNSVFENNVAHSADDYDVDDVYYQTRSPGSGGAIYIFLTAESPLHHDGLVTITNCEFHNNTADLQGGTLFVNPDISVQILHSIINGSASPTVAQAGDLFFASNNITVVNTTLYVSTSNEYSLISYQAANPSSSRLMLEDIQIICLSGHEINIVNISSLASDGGLEALRIHCLACPEEEYSLKESRAYMSGSVANISSAISCRSCPYGAKCHRGIWNTPGFWGHTGGEGDVVMHVCPEDYCEMNVTSLISYDSCTDHRIGTLCGRCEEDYSESMFGTVCVANSECGSHNWYIGLLIGIYGIVYVLFFMFERDWGQFFTYLLKKLRRKNKATKDISDDDVAESGYFQIFMYFIQTSVLLKVRIVIEEDEIYQYVHRPQDLLPAPLIDGIKDILTFDVLAFHGKTCLFTNIDPAKKIGIKFIFVLYLFILLVFFYVLSGCCCICIPHWKRPMTGGISWNSRMIATVVALFLYTYQAVAEDAFLLLNCTNVNGQSVLFLDGNVRCLQSWQFVAIGLVGVFVIPFFISLLFGPKLLQRDKIGLRVFFLSFLFPLFFSVPFILMYMGCLKCKPKRPTEEEVLNHRPPRRILCCGDKEASKGTPSYLLLI